VLSNKHAGIPGVNGGPIAMNDTLLLGIADNKQSFFNASAMPPSSFVTPIYNVLPKAGSSMFDRKHAHRHVQPQHRTSAAYGRSR
jgi:hypothetical protein